MYKVVKVNDARITKIDANHHLYSLIEPSSTSQQSLSIVEVAEVVENIIPETERIYYILEGYMKLNNQTLTKGECCVIPKGESVMIEGTFRAIQITHVNN